MCEVSIRELRNHGGEVVDRVTRGESITITRSGKAVAELVPKRQATLPVDQLLARWRMLPAMDAGRLRRDLDATMDAQL